MSSPSVSIQVETLRRVPYSGGKEQSCSGSTPNHIQFDVGKPIDILPAPVTSAVNKLRARERLAQRVRHAAHKKRIEKARNMQRLINIEKNRVRNMLLQHQGYAAPSGDLPLLRAAIAHMMYLQKQIENYAASTDQVMTTDKLRWNATGSLASPIGMPYLPLEPGLSYRGLVSVYQVRLSNTMAVNSNINDAEAAATMTSDLD